MQRGSRAALRFQVGLVFRQQFQRFQISVPGGAVRRGDPLRIRGVDISASSGQPSRGRFTSRNKSQRKRRQTVIILPFQRTAKTSSGGGGTHVLHVLGFISLITHPREDGALFLQE